jgi:hypothetical protein
MKLDEKLEYLITTLQPAHKIILNDNRLMIIKLHNNNEFYKWLKMLGLIPNFNPIEKINSHNIYITLGIIPASTSKNIRISCCKLDITQLANNIFNDNSSSGIIINGSYFFLPRHVQENMYGIKSNSVQHNISWDFLPVGYFNYDMTTTGKNADTEYKKSTYNITYDGHSLENIKTNAEFIDTEKLTLDLIKDNLGFAIFEKNKSVKILKFDDYKNEDKNNNVIMGNLLVYNNKIEMTEDKLSIGIIIKEIPDIPFDKLDKVYIMDRTFTRNMTQSEINYLLHDSSVNIMSVDHPQRKDNIYFKSLYMPYNVSFLKNNYADFSGKIPPGYPVHASDLNPRTCLMVDQNDNFIIINVEGRNNDGAGGAGIDLFDLAKLCQGMGAKYALNIDGGGSSKMLWKEENNTMSYVGLDNYTISNAIVIQ